MKSDTLRTAVLASMEVKFPTISDKATLIEYADALDEVAATADNVGRVRFASIYRDKAVVLRKRAGR